MSPPEPVPRRHGRSAGTGREVTSREVARLAGVSQPTVSRALRGDLRVSAETRRRVLEAAAALDYVPSEIGRSLSTRATRRVGMLVTDLTNPFYPNLLAPLHDELERRGYRMVLFTERQDEISVVERLIDGSIDGVVLTTSLAASGLPYELMRRNRPFVFLNREVYGVEADACVVDNRLGARLAAEKLIQLGHRTIAAIFGPEETTTGREREAGLRESLAEHGVGLPGSLSRRGPFDFATGYRAMTELLREPVRPSAVFCANDVIAIGAYNAAHRAGLSIPADLTIIGFDDISMASWDVFRLTTVRHDLVAMARNAGNLLVDRIELPDRPVRRIVMEPSLTLRHTHAPPR
ncbi:LacI family DNA-binding transcriptional regulator [Streptosporangium sp. NBC_01756]|uniref:LacI family DNA-binding transcriptional regulator n=1 Tax=Streptosporangium sp. NBC_01756 TaxID=2975950 RepID=UPI002DDBD2E3|nr:LacI family DNA-binding transcriptional regulator [Streptosporangium sp. NBC_01756]WSC87958.1 LacI family transcriptional regulator [Streptosporangium sp. NBC_01756]